MYGYAKTLMLGLTVWQVAPHRQWSSTLGMSLMGSVMLPYLNLKRAKGRLYGYYRRCGKTTRIKGEPGSPEFLEAYNAIHRANEADKIPGVTLEKAIPGSLRALVEDYKVSGKFLQMAPATRASYLWVLEWLLPRYGNLPVADLPRDWVLRRQDELAGMPGKANYFVTVMSVLLVWGRDRRYCSTNVAAGIEKLRTGESYRAWTDAEIEAFTGPVAGRMALPVLIGLYTAQRRGDVIKLPWSAYNGRW